VRRIVSISLLLLFVLPLVSPLFAASTADVNVPACCRRSGKHHCTMVTVAQRSSSDSGKPKTASFQESCPYNLVSLVAIKLPFAPDEIQTSIYAGTVSNSTHSTQAEARFSISFDRSHQKRGPPSLILSHS
jgi:hypothetical protein